MLKTILIYILFYLLDIINNKRYFDKKILKEYQSSKFCNFFYFQFLIVMIVNYK